MSKLSLECKKDRNESKSPRKTNNVSGQLLGSKRGGGVRKGTSEEDWVKTGRGNGAEFLKDDVFTKISIIVTGTSQIAEENWRTQQEGQGWEAGEEKPSQIKKESRCGHFPQIFLFYFCIFLMVKFPRKSLLFSSDNIS